MRHFSLLGAFEQRFSFIFCFSNYFYWLQVKIKTLQRFPIFHTTIKEQSSQLAEQKSSRPFTWWQSRPGAARLVMPNVMIGAVRSFLLPRLRSSDGDVPPAKELHPEPRGRLLLCLCGRSWNWPRVSNGTGMKAPAGSPGFLSCCSVGCFDRLKSSNQGRQFISWMNMFYRGNSWIYQYLHSAV